MSRSYGDSSLENSTTGSIVKDFGNSAKRNVTKGVNEVNRQVQQVADQANAKGREYIKKAQIEFYEDKITKFLVKKFKNYPETEKNADKITEYVDLVINELITNLSESKSIFSSINSLIDSIKGLQPKSSNFDVTKDEKDLLSIENQNLYLSDKIEFVDEFVKKALIDNLENYKKIQSKKIVDQIFSTTLQKQVFKTLNKRIFEDFTRNVKATIGFKENDETKKEREKIERELNSFKGYYKYLIGKKAIINKDNRTNPTHVVSNMLNTTYSDPIAQERKFVEELENILKSIYEQSLDVLQKLRTLQIEEVSQFVSNKIIPDAKKDIQQQQQKLRKEKSNTDANLSDYKIIPDDYFKTKDGTTDYKQFILNFFGFSEENLNKIQAEGDENGYFSIVFKYLFNSIGIAVSNELNQMVGRSIANVSTKYTLSQEETKALKNFGRIIIDIVKNFLSTELISIVFYSISDYYDSVSQKGGADEDEDGIELVPIKKKTENTETSQEDKPSEEEGEKTPCKPCGDSYSSHATNIFSSMGTQLLNTIVKKSIVGDSTEPDQQKQNYNEYIQSIKNIKINMPTLFPEFIQDMIGYMIITLPTNIILFILAIIPIPLPYVLVDSMFKKIKQDLNAIVNLIIDASASNQSSEPINDSDSTTPLSDTNTEPGESPAQSQTQSQPQTQPKTNGGTRKIKRRNKYTKKYYLNRIHNTIKNFYKTNKTKSRFNKRRL
jgi:hypothetical protein